MTKLRNNFSGGTNGTGLTTSNTGGASGDAFQAVDSSIVFSNTRAWGDSPLSAKLPSTAVIGQGRWTVGTGERNGAFRVYVYITAAFAADVGIEEARVTNTSSERFLSVLGSASNKVRLRNSVSATNVFTSSGDFPLNQWVRLERLFEQGVGTTDGRFRLAYYIGDSTTPVEDSGWVANQNLLGATGPSTTILWGKLSTAALAGDMYMAQLAMDNGSDYTGSFIGPAVIPLTTPVVTLGAKTNPTTIGGTNGTQVVTWPAVPNAVAYDALVASGNSPAQGDFSVVATGVTSPYTFTGLGASTARAYGIRARA